MAGYVLMDVEITDHAVFAEFSERVPAVVDSVERAKSWWNSPDHTELRATLDRCSRATTTILEGV